MHTRCSEFVRGLYPWGTHYWGSTPRYKDCGELLRGLYRSRAQPRSSTATYKWCGESLRGVTLKGFTASALLPHIRAAVKP